MQIRYDNVDQANINQAGLSIFLIFLIGGVAGKSEMLHQSDKVS